jgi:hypothetical protein
MWRKDFISYMHDSGRTNETSEYFELLRYALRALHREILQFRFDYPLVIVPEAGPRESLHYYLYSEKLSWRLNKCPDKGFWARVIQPGRQCKHDSFDNNRTPSIPGFPTDLVDVSERERGRRIAGNCYRGW